MKKFIAGASVAAAAALMTAGLAGTAQAYDDNTVSPPTTVSPPKVEQAQAAPASSAAGLPDTGGPNEIALMGGIGLLVAGGAAVVVARRRQSS